MDRATHIHNCYMYLQAVIAGADVIETDGDRIVGFGSDADYDSHADDVQNGNGYYDENGHYCSYGRCPDE